MERMRTKWSLLLGAGWILTMVALSGADAADASAAADVAAAGDDSSSCAPQCPCGCSPLAGAWTARLRSAKNATIVHTFQFVPVNAGCTKFAVNAQVSSRCAEVIKYWPQACDLTEFVGTACQGLWNDVQFTALGYGVSRGDPNRAGAADRIVFLAVMTGLIDLPASCLDCSQPPDGLCNEPEELPMTVYVSYFDAEQDPDCDGRPDEDFGGPVLCLCFETRLRRINVQGPCEEVKTFTACLEPCASAPTRATGRTFLRVLYPQDKIWFLLTDQGLKDVTQATIQVAGTDVVKLAEQQDGDCGGLLVGACFYPRDFLGPWKGKSLSEAVKAIEAGQATVLVCSKQHPAGEISGKIEAP